jgi:hypothetical protein
VPPTVFGADSESDTVFRQRQEHQVFATLLQMIPGLEDRLMNSSEEGVVVVAELVCHLVDLHVHLPFITSSFKKESPVHAPMTQKVSRVLYWIGLLREANPSIRRSLAMSK